MTPELEAAQAALVCPTCDGEGTDYLTIHGKATDTPWGTCDSCGGNGINPDVVEWSQSLGEQYEAHAILMDTDGRYAVIPLEVTE